MNNTKNSDQNQVIMEIFDLVVGRVFKRIYLRLNDDDKAKAKEIFSSGKDADKQSFIEKYIPDFDKIFKEEAEVIKKELEAETK